MLHATGGHVGTIYMRLASTRVQYICDWRPLGYNIYATGVHSGTIYMRLASTRVQYICDWRPLGYDLYATGGHSGTINMRLAATRVRFICDWRPLGYNLYATGRQSHAVFACASGQLRAKPPVFCKHAVTTIIELFASVLRIWERVSGLVRSYKMTSSSSGVKTTYSKRRYSVKQFCPVYNLLCVKKLYICCTNPVIAFTKRGKLNTYLQKSSSSLL
jgi:hypothetical protein